MALINKRDGYEAPTFQSPVEFKQGVYNLEIKNIIGSDGLDKFGQPRVAKVRPDGVVSNWIIIQSEIADGIHQGKRISTFIWLPDTTNFKGDSLLIARKNEERLEKMNKTLEESEKKITHLYSIALRKEMPESCSSDQLAMDLIGKIVSGYVKFEREKDPATGKWERKVNENGYNSYVCDGDFSPELAIADEEETVHEPQAQADPQTVDGSKIEPDPMFSELMDL